MDEGDPRESVSEEARQAFERGDHIFEYSQTVTLLSGYVAGRYSLPVRPVQNADVLNKICREGWEVVNGSLAKWESGSYAYLIGLYVFRRSEGNRPLQDDPARQAVRAPVVA